jgi:phosphatidylinositol alpha-mannosyltransferase
MAAGVPVVASNIEGFAGVITDGLDGVLVKPKDSGAIAAVILRLLRNPAQRQQLSVAGQAQAAHYSWDNVARRVMSYYERLVYEHQELAEVAARRHASGEAPEAMESIEPVNL